MADVQLCAPAPDVILSGPHGRPYQAAGDGTILVRAEDVDYMLGAGCKRIPVRDASGKFTTVEPTPEPEPEPVPAPPAATPGPASEAPPVPPVAPDSAPPTGA